MLALHVLVKVHIAAHPQAAGAFGGHVQAAWRSARSTARRRALHHDDGQPAPISAPQPGGARGRLGGRHGRIACQPRRQSHTKVVPHTHTGSRRANGGHCCGNGINLGLRGGLRRSFCLRRSLGSFFGLRRSLGSLFCFNRRFIGTSSGSLGLSGNGVADGAFFSVSFGSDVTFLGCGLVQLGAPCGAASQHSSGQQRGKFGRYRVHKETE